MWRSSLNDVDELHTTSPRIGIDVGGTHTRVGLIRGDQVLFKRSKATPQTGLNELIARLISLVDEVDRHTLVHDRNKTEHGGIGLAVPGLIDHKGSVVTFASNVRALNGVDLAEILSGRLNRPVTVVNDANAAALAEHRFGAGAGMNSLVYLTISTGIGGGICANGTVMVGHQGWAGEFGHMVVDPTGPVCTCGTRGCLETVASGRAIASAASFTFGREMSSADAFALANQGNESATDVIDRAARGLALGITNVVRAVNPAVVVLGGGVMSSGDTFLRLVRIHLSSFNRNFGPIEVRAALCGDDAGLIGAASLAMLVN